jgi:ABC-type lipoprotein export system ATPase subunit
MAGAKDVAVSRAVCKSPQNGGNTVLVVEQLARPGMPVVGFRLNGGACLAVMGPSGSGKTLFFSRAGRS